MITEKERMAIEALATLAPYAHAIGVKDIEVEQPFDEKHPDWEPPAPFKATDGET